MAQSWPWDSQIAVKKKKKKKVFFYILHGDYLLKQKVVVVQILEWKLKANIARNVTSEGCSGPNFCPIWIKNGKKLII